MIYKNKLFASKLALVLLTAVSQSWAQEAEPVVAQAGSASSDEVVENVAIEEVVVTGIRSGLTKAADYKRYYNGIVDTIVAEDMGKFPDGNLAEALSRLVGVAIDRNNIEGSKVAVRGFGPEFNLVTLNGRQMPTVPGVYNGGRSFDFGDISAHGFEAVQVFKTPTAQLPTGGIGSTINIVTAKPLNAPGFKGSFSVGGVIDSTDIDDDVTPEIDFFVTNTFLNDRLGISLSGSRQERTNREEGLQETSWFNTTDIPGRIGGATIDASANTRADGTLFFPEKIGFQVKDNERERNNAQATVQFDVTETVRATVDYTYSEVEFKTEGNQFGSYLGGFDMTSGIANSNGSIVDSSYAGGTYTHSATWGFEDSTNKSLGFNVEWQATDSLALTFDYHDSSAEKDGTGLDNSISFINANWPGWGDAGIFEPAATLNSRDVSFGRSGIPSYDFDVSNSFQGNNIEGYNEIQANDLGSTNGTFNRQKKRNELQQFQIDGKWENLDGMFVDSLQSIEFGISRMEQEVRDTRASNFIIQGAGNDGTSTVLNYVQYDDSIFSRTSLSGFMDESGTNPEGYYLAIDVPAAAAAFSRAGWGPDAPPALWWAQNYANCEIVSDAAGTGFTDLATGERGDDRCLLNAGPTTVDGTVEEELTAIYAQFNFESEINGMPLNVSAGLRYEDAETTSTALSQIASDILWNVDGFNVLYNGEVPVAISASNSYVLPNLSISLGVSETGVVRFSASKSIARAGINDLRSVLAFTQRQFGENAQANSGNPGLEPLESNNFDIAYENYYAEGSYFAIGYFRKDISGFLTSSTKTQSYGTLTDPFLGDFANQARADIAAGNARGDTPVWANELQTLWWNTAGQEGSIGICYGGAWVCPPEYIIGEATDPLALIDIVQPDNGKSGTVDGWEIAIQHQFRETGFGVSANATFVGGDVEADVYSLGEQFALPGFGDSANLAAFYEDDKWQATVGWNYRDETYAGVDGSNNPIFLEARGQLDLTGAYKVNDNVTIFVEARNVTDEPVRLFVRQSEMIFLAQDHGPMYKFGLRANF
ncbi:MAG: TonB-dependent receptor [Gammaproteobacteria bacterium]|nr:TonB-dependent receptor [Gammaproteobacteria bacterium]